MSAEPAGSAAANADRGRSQMPLTGLLQVHKLCLTLGGREVLQDISFDLPAPAERGQLLWITGPNGAGKSQLLRCLHGMAMPSAGRITWADTDPDRRAFMAQHPVFLTRSARANLVFVVKAKGRPLHVIDEALAATDLTTRAGQRADRLSGGQQQRLALARALVTAPDVFLLDEPTAHLDRTAASQMEEQLTRLHQQGRSLIRITHDMGAIETALAAGHGGRVLTLIDGQLAADLPAAEFLATRPDL